MHINDTGTTDLKMLRSEIFFISTASVVLLKSKQCKLPLFWIVFLETTLSFSTTKSLARRRHYWVLIKKLGVASLNFGFILLPKKMFSIILLLKGFNCVPNSDSFVSVAYFLSVTCLYKGSMYFVGFVTIDILCFCRSVLYRKW